MDKPAPDNLLFDDVVIDFAGRRLLRAGVVQALEPKAFAVLALLGGAPGHVFTRDEILDAVWGHRHVTPGVLNRVMTLLRHALGEDAQSPHYLHTVHGVGYRFDLPAAAGPPLAAVPASESAPVPAAVPGPAPPPHLHRRAGDALPAARPIPTPPPRRRASDWRRSRRPGQLAWIALLLAAAGAAGWALWPWAPPSPAPAPAPAPVAPALDARGRAAYQLPHAPLLLRFREAPRFAAFRLGAGLPPPSASDALDIDRIRAQHPPALIRRAGGAPARPRILQRSIVCAFSSTPGNRPHRVEPAPPEGVRECKRLAVNIGVDLGRSRGYGLAGWATRSSGS